MSASQGREQPVRLGEGVGQPVGTDDHGGAVGARLDPEHEVAVVEGGVADEPATGPELSHAVRRLLRADDAHLNLVHAHAGCSVAASMNCTRSNRRSAFASSSAKRWARWRITRASYGAACA